MQNLDVLIVGAGPTGLMMACECARHGLTCRIIDQNQKPIPHSRALAIQARTLEIFAHLGIVEPFLAAGIKIQAVNSISQHKLIAHVDFKGLDSPYPFILALEQTKTEELLLDHLTSFGMKVERPVELRGFQQEKESVHAFLYDHATGKEMVVQSSYLIGCDGAHSSVRKILKLPFKGRAFADIFSLADLHIKWAHPHDEAFAFLDAQGVMAIFPLPPPNRYRLIFQLERCRKILSQKRLLMHSQLTPEIVADPTIEEATKMLLLHADPNAIVYEPVWMANFHINSRMTSKYREGRVFLVGDAAHIHSPVGGQGMNTGLQDAFNLVWKIAAFHRKQAPDALLDTYCTERQQVGHALLKATERASHIATLHNSFLITLRNIFARKLLKLPSVLKKITRAIAQIAIRYQLSPFIIDKSPHAKGPKAGSRAPNAPIFHNGTLTDLYSLWRNKTSYIALLFSGPNRDASALTSLLKHLDDYPDVYQMHIIHGSQGSDFSDPYGSAHTIYGSEGPALYILRPDLYICFRKSIN